MRRRFFQQNLLLILLPVLIPTLILGVVTVCIVRNYFYRELERSNTIELQYISEQVDSIMNEFDRINISLSNNPSVVLRLKRVLSQSEFGVKSEEITAINTVADLVYSSLSINGNIGSIYIYFNNVNNLYISSENRISQLDISNDREWYDSYLQHIQSAETVWTEIRQVPAHSDEYPPTRYLTIYRKIYASSKALPDGVLVMNVQMNSINKVLDRIVSADKQAVIIVNKSNNEVLFHNDYFNQLRQRVEPEIEEIYQRPQDSFHYKISGVQYLISQQASSNDEWQCISMIPSADVYRVPNLLTSLIVIIILSVMLVGIFISYYFTCRNYNDIQTIIEIIKNAINGVPPPPKPRVSFDVHQYIIHNILQTFVENEYLLLQLSEKKYQLKTMELLALQSQLNPHFLFNTMETLYWKSIKLSGTQNESTRIIENLSNILRYVLDSNEEFVPLQKEINMTQSYLDIQLVRYQDKFGIIWDYPESAGHIKVPKLLLQPLIENSIYHGAKPSRHKSMIKTRIQQTDQGIHIAVIDSGVGIERSLLAEIQQRLQQNDSVESAGHIGLYNTNKRLQLLYGESSRLKIYSKRNFGTIVQLMIPENQ